MNTIIQKIKNREWDVVSHLALQTKTHRNLRKQEEAINLLRIELGVEQTSVEQNAIVFFSARALEYIPGPKPEVRGLVLAIIDASIKRATTGDDYGSFKDVVQCEQCTVERQEFVRKLLAEG